MAAPQGHKPLTLLLGPGVKSVVAQGLGGLAYLLLGDFAQTGYSALAGHNLSVAPCPQPDFPHAALRLGQQRPADLPGHASS